MSKEVVLKSLAEVQIVKGSWAGYAGELLGVEGTSARVLAFYKPRGAAEPEPYVFRTKLANLTGVPEELIKAAQPAVEEEKAGEAGPEAPAATEETPAA